MDQPQKPVSRPPATGDMKRRRRLDQLTLEELRPLASMLGRNDDAPQLRERWTPGRTAKLTRDARAARLLRNLPVHAARDRKQR